jgi:Aldehyde dehydrogenase family
MPPHRLISILNQNHSTMAVILQWFPRYFLVIILQFSCVIAQESVGTCLSNKISSKNSPPMVPALLMKNGIVIEPSADDVSLEDVMGCCGICNEDSSSASSYFSNVMYKPQMIGRMPQMTEEQALEVLQAAREAWNGGTGIWPQMSLRERIQATENFLRELQSSRQDIIQVLMWEIGKNLPDATSEFDRTIQFIQTMISEIRSDPEFQSVWEIIGSTRAFVRRTAIGIILCLGPYNYPLNETWAMAFAALLAGNVLIMKIPTVGGLCHLLTSKYS